MADEETTPDCEYCGDFYHLYAVFFGKPCPDCGRGVPTGKKMRITDNPYLLGPFDEEVSHDHDH
jgi:hypothetical protein